MLSTLTNIAVIAAHPDDEVLGCGATMRKLADHGARVEVLILGEGVTSRSKNRDVIADRDALKRLSEDCKKANKILGSNGIVLKDFPDNRFDSIGLLDIVKVIEDFLIEKKVQAVFTHHRGDLNIDHQITNRAVVTACRPSSKFSPDYILTFDVLSSTEWHFGSRENLFSPNLFVNVEKELKYKIDAMACYDSEIHHFPLPRSTESIESQAKRYGSMSNYSFAEAFELIFSRHC
ncbi:MAG: PIG-L family deacetylase [Candidatus Brocadiales bacterium]|nr:PIG-L family deacetylase [Candidatus Brocadiales bacterium]